MTRSSTVLLLFERQAAGRAVCVTVYIAICARASGNSIQSRCLPLASLVGSELRSGPVPSQGLSLPLARVGLRPQHAGTQALGTPGGLGLGLGCEPRPHGRPSVRTGPAAALLC